MHTLRGSVLWLAVLSGCGAVVQGSGTSQTDTRTVTAFTHVSVADELNVELTDRAAGSVTVTADDNVLEFVSTDSSDGTLHVFVKDGHWLNPKTPVVVEVGRSSVEDVEATGASKVHSDSGLSCDAVGLHTSGASSIALDSVTATGALSVDASGSSHVTLRAVNAAQGSFTLSGASEVDTTLGSIATLTLSLSGASNLKLGGIVSQTAAVQASGASHAELQAQQSASGDASGASNLIISGNPATRDVSTSGGSTLVYP